MKVEETNNNKKNPVNKKKTQITNAATYFKILSVSVRMFPTS